ncbi:MAG: hypothetical protein JNM34_12440 [Chthonomonadaceae bacterium]|nr:hypothetical protein [Chthonomonadaceae bacterium]
MKTTWILAALSLACRVQAQVWAPGFATAFQEAQKPRQLPPPNPQAGDRFRLIHADKTKVSGDTIEASGGVHAVFRGYDMFADHLQGSRKTQVFTLSGNARVVGEKETVTGSSVTVDFKSGQFGFEKGTAVLHPERLDGQTQSDLYVSAKGGAGDRQDFLTEDGKFTFCEDTPPHFELKYGTGRVLPNKRIELRKFDLEILGKTVIRLPMLVIPLDRRTPKYLPEVGQSVDEGYFVKNRFSSPLPGESYLDTRVDLMTLQGIGLGWDYIYKNSFLDGKATVYGTSSGNKSKVYTLQHSQNLLHGVLNLDSIFQSSDYLTAPDSKLWNTNANFRMPTGRGTSSLLYNRFSNASPGFDSTNETWGLSDDRTVGVVNSRLNMSYNTAKTVLSGSNSTLSRRFDIAYGASADFRNFDADLVYQRSVPIGRTTNFYSSSDVTPMLSLRSTARQLFGEKADRVLPFSLSASVGELVNPSSTNQSKVTRLFFDFGFRRTETAGDRTTLDWGTQFKQGLYSDDTAQYVLAYDSNLNYRFAKDSSLALTYSNLRAFGFTPLAIDSTGRTDAFSLDLNYSPLKSVVTSLQTGYDVYQGSLSEVPWQFVWLRNAWKPGPWMTVSASGSYDTFNQAWSNFRFDSAIDVRGLGINFGARYDGLRSQWAGFNALVTGFKLGKLTTNFLLDYNGYDQRMDSQHYQFIYDLHCTEAILEVIENQAGFRSGRTVAFYIRLKAIPSGSDFRQGTRGQSIGGGYGFGN